MKSKRIVFILNTSEFFLSHRKDLAQIAKNQGYDVAIITPYSPIYSKKIKDLGFDYFEFNMSRKGINPIVEITRLLRFISLIKKIKPDIIHAFTPKPILYSSIASLFLNYKLIISFTGLGHVFTDNSLKINTIRFFLKKILRTCFIIKKPKIVFQNPDDQRLFSDLKIVKSQDSKIIPGTGVNTNIFTYTTKNTEPIIVFPARFLKDKGLIELIESCKLLKNKNISFELWLMGKVDAGNPSSISEYEYNEIQKLNFVKKIEYSDSMFKIYEQAQIVCLPSYREGIPLSLIEASACGRAIVTTDVPGCRSVVDHEINGLLVPKKTIEPLAQALEKILSDCELRKKMELASRKKALDLFDQKNVLLENLKLYA